MGEVLDYATPRIARSPSRLPYIVVASIGTALAVVILGVHCVNGVAKVTATSRFDREEAWMRFLATAPECIMVVAGAWWAARRVDWNVRWFRRAFWVCGSVWLGTLLVMAIRLAV